MVEYYSSIWSILRSNTQVLRIIKQVFPPPQCLRFSEDLRVPTTYTYFDIYFHLKYIDTSKYLEKFFPTVKIHSTSPKKNIFEPLNTP